MYHFGLIGHPLGHSHSPQWMAYRFKQLNIDAKYSLIDIDNINQFLSVIQSRQWNGFNVTIPYKRLIIPYLHSLNPTAAQIQAVNTIKVCPDNTLCGYNTDIIGFLDTLRPHLNPSIPYSALILGNGGASQAVQYALSTLQIPYTIVHRHTTPPTLHSSLYTTIHYSSVTPSIISSHSIIINTTPLGMAPNAHTYPPIPYQAITPQHIAYDLVYNPDPTLFLQKAACQGATIISGIQMLHAQADASLRIWLDN